MRNTKTEYVSCPSCGRTLFDLQEVTEQIRQKTGHLPGERRRDTHSTQLYFTAVLKVALLASLLVLHTTVCSPGDKE